MAGVKGKSGGPRRNAGGARPGAGRPAAKAEPTPLDDPMGFLLAVQKGEIEPSPAQLKAAIAMLPYKHARKEGGKKDAAAEAAKSALGGRFKPASGPRLAAVGGRTVAGD